MKHATAAEHAEVYEARLAELREMPLDVRHDATRTDLMFAVGLLLGSGWPGTAAAVMARVLEGDD